MKLFNNELLFNVKECVDKLGRNCLNFDDLDFIEDDFKFLFGL